MLLLTLSSKWDLSVDRVGDEADYGWIGYRFEPEAVSSNRDYFLPEAVKVVQLEHHNDDGHGGWEDDEHHAEGTLNDKVDHVQEVEHDQVDVFNIAGKSVDNPPRGVLIEKLHVRLQKIRNYLLMEIPADAHKNHAAYVLSEHRKSKAGHHDKNEIENVSRSIFDNFLFSAFWLRPCVFKITEGVSQVYTQHRRANVDDNVKENHKQNTEFAPKLVVSKGEEIKVKSVVNLANFIFFLRKYTGIATLLLFDGHLFTLIFDGYFPQFIDQWLVFEREKVLRARIGV